MICAVIAFPFGIGPKLSADTIIDHDSWGFIYPSHSSWGIVEHLGIKSASRVSATYKSPGLGSSLISTNFVSGCAQPSSEARVISRI